MQRIDKYTGNTYIDRKFTEDMEIDVNDVEALFDQFLSAPELKEVGKIISKRSDANWKPTIYGTMASRPVAIWTRTS